MNARTLILLLLIAGSTLANLPAQAPWSLRDCIEYALDNNIQLQQQALTQQSSDVDLRQAKLERSPDLNFFTNYGFNLGWAADPFTNIFQQQQLHTVNLSLRSQVTLFAGNRINNSIKRSKLDYEAAKEDLQQQEYSLVLDVTLAYMQILFNEELLKSAKAQISSTQEQADRTGKLVRAGTLAQADLLQIQSQIASEELTMTNAENDLNLAYLSLVQLMRFDPSEPFSIVEPVIDDPNRDYLALQSDQVYVEAESVQPFIRAADLRVQSAYSDIHLNKSSYFPSITASGTYFTGATSTRKRFDQVPGVSTTPAQITDDSGNTSNVTIAFPSEDRIPQPYPFTTQWLDNRALQISVGLSVPIYNRRNFKSGVQRAEIRYKQAELNAELLRQQLEQTIEQAYLNMKSAFSSFQSSVKQVEALELAMINTEKRFELGAVNSVEYLQAKIRLNIAQVDVVRTKFDYLLRTKILDYYMGKPMDF